MQKWLKCRYSHRNLELISLKSRSNKNFIASAKHEKSLTAKYLQFEKHLYSSFTNLISGDSHVTKTSNLSLQIFIFNTFSILVLPEQIKNVTTDQTFHTRINGV